jgi:hypothetical protein
MQSVARLSSLRKVNLTRRNFRLPEFGPIKSLGTLSLLFGGRTFDDKSRRSELVDVLNREKIR